jgi:hypothetical protein
LNNERHREAGPAIIWPDGTQEWWIHGLRHRVEGPAIIRADGEQEWWLNGKLHRQGGPAIIDAAGGEAWYVDGQQHRLDGPACTRGIDGIHYWVVYGKPITDEVQAWQQEQGVTWPWDEQTQALFILRFA